MHHTQVYFVLKIFLVIKAKRGSCIHDAHKLKFWQNIFEKLSNLPRPNSSATSWENKYTCMDFNCTNFETMVLVEFLINKIVLVEFILCITQLVRILQSTIFPGSKNYTKRGPPVTFITDFFSVFTLPYLVCFNH